MKNSKLTEYIEFSEERFTKRIIFKEGESTVFALNFAPGQALPAHKHPGTNVFLLVVQGEGVFTIDQEQVRVSEGNVIHCDGHEELSFLNDSSANTSLYVMLNKIPDENYAKNI